MSNLKTLVLAGGTWQVPLISFLQKKGYSVTVADPYFNSEGVLIANEHIQVDVRDSEKLLKIITDKSLLFDFIISDQSDVAIQTLAFLNKHMHLPGVLPDVAELFTNKYAMRDFAVSMKIPGPKYLKCKNENDVLAFYNSINKKSIIIKPADSQSSRGIFKVDDSNLDLIPEFLENCFSNTQLKFVICEECIEGIELTAEGFCSGNNHRTLAISEKKHFRFGIASDLIYPADISETIQVKLRLYNDLFVNNSGLNFGITHAEYIYNLELDEVFLVEIACRGGGTLISSHITPWVSNVNVYELLYASLTGQEIDVEELIVERKSAILHFFEYENGIVKSIEGVTEIAAMKSTFRFQLDFKVGDSIKSATDDRSRQGFVILLAQNKIELLNELNKVEKNLKVIIN